MKIVTLTLAPAFDIHCDADSINLNHENIARITSYDIGGKGINISKALNKFDVPNTAVVVLGNENSAIFVKELENDNFCFHKIDVEGRIRENITIHTQDGKETRISFTAATVPANTLERIEKITNKLLSFGDVLTFTGRLPDGIAVADAIAYIKRLSDKGVRIVLDSKSFSLEDVIKAAPFLIKPNEEEISEYMGRQISDLESCEIAARQLSARGIQNVMITLGGRGALLCSESEIYIAHAPDVKVASTIGAGDSAIAGFLYAFAGGASPCECLKTAVAFGSAACMSEGTAPPEQSDVRILLEKIK